MSNIKKLNEFAVNEDVNWGNFFNNVFSLAGEGFRTTIKTRITAVLLEKLGLKEKTLLCAFVENFVQEIPVMDLPKIISGESLGSSYWVPKLSDSIRRFIDQKGIDTIAESMGINTNPPGLAYTYFRNILLSRQGQEKIAKMFADIFDSANVGPETINSLDDLHKARLSDAMKRQMGPNYKPQDSSSTGMSDTVYGLLSKFLNPSGL